MPSFTNGQWCRGSRTQIRLSLRLATKYMKMFLRSANRCIAIILTSNQETAREKMLKVLSPRKSGTRMIQCKGTSTLIELEEETSQASFRGRAKTMKSLGSGTNHTRMDGCVELTSSLEVNVYYNDCECETVGNPGYSISWMHWTAGIDVYPQLLAKDGRSYRAMLGWRHVQLPFGILGHWQLPLRPCRVGRFLLPSALPTSKVSTQNEPEDSLLS